ncbi:phage capsid scaffolding (GPO) serine peptidase family protein [Escherichia coli P0299917.1]|nr:phage capsid scaffolding (GPO) serine peptidase family protein [Escherichia coli P0299917.1]
MANEKKTSRKKFRVAVSGSTVDGREISPVHLREAAENFNPDVYAARVNVEHYLSPCPSSEFSAMGDVTALSTEDITEGPLAGRTALYAEIEPTERMKQLVADGKKIYSSIELDPQSTINGRAYLVGLAMTDTPASLGTERLKFTAQQRQAADDIQQSSRETRRLSPKLWSQNSSNSPNNARKKAPSGLTALWGLLAVAAKRMTPVSPVFRKRWKVSQHHRPTLSTVLMHWKPAISRTARKSLH